jgi:hypothetical protein
MLQLAGKNNTRDNRANGFFSCRVYSTGRSIKVGFSLAQKHAVVHNLFGRVHRRNELIIDEETGGDRNLLVESGDIHSGRVRHSVWVKVREEIRT